MLQIRLLGQFDLRAGGKHIVIHSRKAQALFAFLALTIGEAHRREHISGVLWPEMSEPQGRHHLRQELWRIRHALHAHALDVAEIIVADEFTCTLNDRANLWLDTLEFERETPNHKSLADLLTKASLYRGELLPGFYEDWITPARERFTALFEATMCDLLNQLVAAKHWHNVIAWAEHWISISQSPEPAFCALMLAYHALRDPPKILGAYARCRTVLQELGISPADETTALYRRLLEASHLATLHAPICDSISVSTTAPNSP